MRLFSCPTCGGIIHFEDTRCPACGQEVGYLRSRRTIVALTDGAWLASDGTRHPLCANARIGCNWVAQYDDEQCFSCRLTRHIPEHIDAKVAALLASTAAAKRRLIFQLDELRLPIVGHRRRPEGGLAFDLDETISEAEDSHREALRAQLDEPYRTMLGHFRHEIGHYYWQVLVAPRPEWLDRFRGLFGDERQDYGAALDTHYGAKGDGVDWRDHFISQYATTHPWEDFAETFAHLLHIADALQTVAAHGMELHLPPAWPAAIRARHSSVPREELAPGATGKELLQAWEPLAEALNQVNRSMGRPPLYPFTVAEAVRPKLGYILDLVRTFGAPRERTALEGPASES